LSIRRFAANTRHALHGRLWDDPNHREGWHYRSDHLPTRNGVPAIFFSTLLHPDYHTPFDNPDRIDIAKLAKMTR
jgi:hypothetical protein